MQSDWAERLDRAIERRFDQIVALRRYLHAHPEPSGEEHGSTLHVYQLLGDEGLAPRMGPEGRGVLVDQAAHRDAELVAVRADLDGLCIQDQKSVAYRSQTPGVMHACGHDAHTAIVYGATLGLKDLIGRDEIPWPVNYRAIFQPAEETVRGAAEMIEAGCLENVRAIFATHVDPSRDVGRIGWRTGVLTASCDEMQFIVTGRGGHAARPHEASDPIAAAAQLISSIYLFVPRATDSQDAVVVTIGEMHGGENANVIPEFVRLRGTLRTLDHLIRERTVQHIRQLAKGIAETSGTRIDVSFTIGVHSVRNDAHLGKLVRSAAGEVVGPEQIDRVARPSMGAEDFATYLDHVPGFMFRLGCGSDRVGRAALHTPMFDVDDEALVIGARILGRALIRACDPALDWNVSKRTSDGAAASVDWSI